MADRYNFSDLFISYSRRDKDFARKVFEQLKTQNRSVWADWEDIAPTVEWWQEIQAGIESANNFIFIISPDSVMSKVCRDEIEHALSHRKRLIPILYREVVEKDHQANIHPTISSHNWIFCRDADDFGEAFNKLTEALDTDLAHTRLHTRLLVRANEWDSRKRDKGFLLRGSELQESAEWVRNGAEKQPKPTQVQLDYIVASRSAEIARLRNFAGRVTVAMVIIAVLAVVAVVLAVKTEQARDIAAQNEATAIAAVATSDMNANIAVYSAETAIAAVATSDMNANIAATSASIASTNEAQAFARGTDVAYQAATAVAARKEVDYALGLSQSLALAAQTNLELDGAFPERGVLLALEALRTYPYTLEAERTLASTVQETRTFYQRPDIYAAALSPVDDRVALIDYYGVVSVLSSSGEEKLLPETPQFPVSLAWSPDGKTLAVGYETGEVWLWNSATLEPVLEFKAHDDSVNTIHFSPDGSRLITASLDSTARIWDVASGSQQLEMVNGFNMMQAVFSPDGKYIATTSLDAGAVWDATTGEMLHALDEHIDLMFDIAWSPDSQFLLTGSVDGAARIWNRETGETIYQVQHNGGISRVAWAGDNSYFFTGGMDGTLKAWDTVIRAEAFSYAVSSSGVTQIDWIKNDTDVQSDFLITGGRDGILRFSWIHPYGQRLSISTTDNNLTDAVWSPDGTQFITGSRDGNVRIFDAKTGEQRLQFYGDEEVAWSPEGSAVAASVLDESDNYTAAVWDVDTGEQRFQLPEQFPYVSGVAFSPDSTALLVAASDGTLYFYDAMTGALQKTIEVNSPLRSIAWSPDGNWIAAGSTATLQIVRVETWEITATLPDILTAQSLAWSPDSTLLAAGFLEAGDIALLNTDLITEVTMSGHTAAINGLGWSPDGTRLVSGSDDRTVRVWNTAIGYELRTIHGYNGAVSAAAWSPDGTLLLSASKDRYIKVWQAWLTLAQLMHIAEDCCVVRELLPHEREQFNLPEAEE